MKKFLLAIPMTIMLGLSMMFMSACNDTSVDNRTFVVNQSIKTQTETIVSEIVDKVYNKSETFGTYNTYSVEQVKKKLPQFEYYVEAGSLSKFGKIEKISLNGTEFSVDENVNSFKLSVGMNNFIQDKIFYEKEGRLYVAAPIIAFESTINSKIKINDKEFDLNISPATASLNITDAKFNAGAQSTVERVGTTNEFNVTIKGINNLLGFFYEGADAQGNDVFLTKKVLGGVLQGYGLTKANDKIDGTCVLAYYPTGYFKNTTYESKAEEFYQNYNGKKFDYTIYCVGKGTAKIKLNYTVEKPQA